uniref:NADH-ubiquinone oxidoreductase chain 2 n=1 Tax=Anthenea aspera TaxID=2769427 RepID=A0A7S8HPK7_9ECHI|nr:NADH dehydrogenase subunit 2 [Anthenea aspera]QPC56433.1 NADH dehydrogenase subunit 2 [Anthenea aspera]
MHRMIFLSLSFSVVLGTFIVFTSSHWFFVWVGLELNTLSIISLLCGNFSPRSVESSVKYFLVQSVGAALILNVVIIQAWFCCSWDVNHSLDFVTSLLITLGLGLKLGLFPCHFWFPDVVQGVSLVSGMVLSTWQKLAPFIVLVSVVDSLSVELLVCMGVLSVLVGGWGGLNQTQVRKILAFSSVAHMGWIFATVAYSVGAASIMLLVYIIINSGVFLLASEFGVKSLSEVSRLVYISYGGSVGLALGVLSLGGLPPLLGFSVKFVSLWTLVGEGSFFPSGVLVAGSLLSLFFYLRIAFSGALMLYPQHSLAVFGWRSIGFYAGGGFTLRGFVLGLSISLSLFGLFSLPIFISAINN